VEKKAADEMEMAEKENKERKKIKETAQGWVKIAYILLKLNKSKTI